MFPGADVFDGPMLGIIYALRTWVDQVESASRLGSLPPANAGRALSSWSSRRGLLRLARSGPWQAKQRSERMGRTSRLKSTEGAAAKTRPAQSIPMTRKRNRTEGQYIVCGNADISILVESSGDSAA